MHACKKSAIGRRLARFFCGLLIGSPMGINSKWISTSQNTIADEMSRLKKNKQIALFCLRITQTEIQGAESLSFLSAESRDALNDLGHLVDREFSMSKSNDAIETEWARQAHFIEWCQKKQMKDVCGNQPGWTRIIACYGKDLMLDTNWNNKNELRSQTVRGYFNAVNNIFLLRDFHAPVNFDDKQNMTSEIVQNSERKEDIATQCKPITMEMFAEIIKRGNASNASQETKLLASVAKFAKVLGPKSSEYAQKTILKVYCHAYPSGKAMIKAWIRKDFTFYDNKNRVIKTSNHERSCGKSHYHMAHTKKNDVMVKR